MPSVYKGCDGLAQGGVVDGGVSIKLCADLSCADLSCWPFDQGVGGGDRPNKQLGLVLTSDESENPASTNRLGRILKVTCATRAMSRRRWCQLAKRKKNSRPLENPKELLNVNRIEFLRSLEKEMCSFV